MDSPHFLILFENGEQYLLHYDVDSGGFDFQGYNKGYERYHLARYHNGNINSGVVSIWGVLAYIEESGGELILCRSADDQRIASIDDITKTQYLEYAATKIEKDLEDSGKYWGWKKIAENLETYLDNNYNNYNYSKTRFVAESLEKFSRYLLFVYKKELWDECKKIMEIFQTHLKTKIVYSEATFGVESDYPDYFGGYEFQTAALVIRAVYAYYQAVNASYYTFLNLSTVFMRDILSKDWSSFNPNGRMQVMWVINRRYEHGLEDENRLKAATNILLVPVINEQITAPEEWIDDIPRGFGGWMHSMRSTIPSKDEETYLFSMDEEYEDDLNKGIIPDDLKRMFETKAKITLSENAIIAKKDDNWTITDEGEIYIVKKEDRKRKLKIYYKPFSNKYKQWMGYHLFIVRGLAEFYRLAHRKGINGEKYLSFYIKNCPYNLMGATYWVYKLSKGNGSIMDRWNNPKVDGCQTIYGTFGGLSAVYEIMRTIPVQNHMPYCLNDPTCCSDRTFKYDDLIEMLESARKYADKYFRSGLDYYPGLLLYYYNDFRPNLF